MGTLGEPVGDRLLFAGEATARSSSAPSTAPTSVGSARRAGFWTGGRAALLAVGTPGSRATQYSSWRRIHSYGGCCGQPAGESSHDSWRP